MKKITSFTSHITAEGTRLSATYSVIDETTGNITTSNERFNTVVVNSDIQSDIDAIMKFLYGKIPL